MRIVGFGQPVEESPSMSDSERMRYLWRKYKIEKEIKAEAQNLRAGINKFDSLDKYNKALEKQK